MNAVLSHKNSETIFTRYKKSFASDISLVSTAKKGLKAQAAFDFISISDLSQILIEKIFTKSVKTFNNYKEKNTLFDPMVSEKLLRLFALYDKGASVFGNIDSFNKWMATPSYGLGEQVPQNLLDTITGIQLISDELGRIQHGDLA